MAGEANSRSVCEAANDIRRAPATESRAVERQNPPLYRTADTEAGAVVSQRVRRPRISSDVLLAAAVAGGVAILILPLPAAVIDALLSAQLAAAVVMLLIATGSTQPSRLVGFPVALLVLTLLRLALNVATTRAILARGEAGQVVAAFGDAVVGGDLVVGVVVFAVLTLAQYLVIAQGAGRIAEVSARFALDALPGRLAGIEAELRAGQLQAESARSRRQALARTSGLYGAMDGVMRFVRGDAIAGLCIVGVNIIGGLALGLWRQGLALEEALATYTVLTVGDGLAAQLPAVLQTAAAALLATRLASPSGGPGEGLRSSLVDARPLYGTAALFAALAVLPGLPAAPMLAVAGGLGLAGRLRRQRLPPFEPTPDPAEAATVPLTLVVHPMAVIALRPLDLPRVVADAQHRLVHDHGLHLPAPRLVTDPTDIAPSCYRIEIGGATVARGLLLADRVFVCPCPPGESAPRRHPHHDAPGRWAPSGPGIDAAEYLAAHLASTWRRSGPTALGVQAVADRVARLEGHQPALVRAVVPTRVSVPRLAALMQALVAEDVPVRDLAGLLERLAAQPIECDDAERLARLRRDLAPLLTARAAPTGRVAVMHATPALEAELCAGAERVSAGLVAAVVEQIDQLRRRHPEAVWLVSAAARPTARATVGRRLPGLMILAHPELWPGVDAHTVGIVDGEG